jgi:hypothetical protein
LCTLGGGRTTVRRTRVNGSGGRDWATRASEPAALKAEYIFSTSAFLGFEKPYHPSRGVCYHNERVRARAVRCKHSGLLQYGTQEAVTDGESRRRHCRQDDSLIGHGCESAASRWSARGSHAADARVSGLKDLRCEIRDLGKPVVGGRCGEAQARHLLRSNAEMSSREFESGVPARVPPSHGVAARFGNATWPIICTEGRWPRDHR